MSKKGFTIIELILVITILGIIAVAALPKFLDMSTSSRQASRDGVVGAVRSGITLYRANDIAISGGAGSYPAMLDNIPASQPCTDCFSNILETGVNDTRWRVVAASRVYSYNDGSTVTTYTYNTTDGSFQVTE